MKTKFEELTTLLDVVFDSAEEPDWSAVQEFCFISQHSTWLMTEMFKLLWLCAQDGAAFDEEIWRLTNSTM